MMSFCNYEDKSNRFTSKLREKSVAAVSVRNAESVSLLMRWVEKPQLMVYKRDLLV